jgi:hypothetical protein
MVYYQTNDVQRGAVVKTLGQIRQMRPLRRRHAGRRRIRVPGLGDRVATTVTGVSSERTEAG